MSLKNSSIASRRLVRGVMVAGAVFMATGAGAVTAEARTSADGPAVHTSVTVPAPLTGEDDLGWQ
ncbi:MULTISPECIES: hypothetical protein [Streptomyces]|jgi:hypothetical protein|uniref:hypothetical protein n=1 Tax=Streptomyces TaxID=1883 RepID=UPI000749D348|nr:MULTISPECIES: hypothetical protein [Streptomyces]KUL69500.1 hypothetical protein ADL33_30000 [Streptomyces sp. NRRL WC-3604]KUL75123.1 hypothetical protein ADL34_15655 [Streptomyces sp. NRRL WC-3605]